MKSICVYCGSNSGRLESYAASARQLAAALVRRDLRLVYGGARVGIMGVVADAVLGLGGEVVGVIPASLVRKEVAHAGLTQLHVTASMHERKTMMADLADGFVALPGGIGTLEEIFEMWTWAQLGFHQKPCGLLNAAGYFDALTGFLDHAERERFVAPSVRAMLIVETDPDRLLDRLDDYTPPRAHQWVGKDEL